MANDNIRKFSVGMYDLQFEVGGCGYRNTHLVKHDPTGHGPSTSKFRLSPMNFNALYAIATGMGTNTEIISAFDEYTRSNEPSEMR